MSNFSSMTFTITKIEQEKSIDGVMRIYFVPNDGVRYGTAFMITLEKRNGGVDKYKLRQSMLAWYEDFKQEGLSVIKVGDII